MAQKIIVSDTDSGHASTMKSNIESICPTAQVDIRIESFQDSVDYAIANSYNGVSRSTTGLNDYRIETAGKDAADGEVWTVHSHASNVDEYISNPSYMSYIIAARAPNCSYGPGVEFTVDTNNESNACSYLAGMMGQILTISSSLTIDEARQSLRETANNFSAGWTGSKVGFGTVDWQAAISNSNDYILNSFYEVNYSDNRLNYINFNWNKFSSNDNIIARFSSEMNISSSFVDGVIIYSGSNETYNYNHNLEGHYYFGFYVSGSESRLESFSILNANLTVDRKVIFINKGSGQKIKFTDRGVGKKIKIF